jgi:hypothetical protein
MTVSSFLLGKSARRIVRAAAAPALCPFRARNRSILPAIRFLAAKNQPLKPDGFTCESALTDSASLSRLHGLLDASLRRKAARGTFPSSYQALSDQKDT